MQACTWKEQRMAPSWYKSDEISSRDKAQKILFDADGAYTLQWDEFPLTYTIIPKTQQLSEKHWGVWGVSGGKLTQQHGDQELQLKTHGRGWAELCLPSLKKEGRLRPAVVNYLFLVTRNAERTLFAWRKTIISYKKKKITMRSCSTEKVAQQGCAICAPGDFQNEAGKSLPLTWKLSAVRRSMGYTTWEALSNLNYSFIQITGYRHHYYCIC